jgi:hypothetical protein
MIHLVYGYLYGEAESNASGFTDSWRYLLPCHPLHARSRPGEFIDGLGVVGAGAGSPPPGTGRRAAQRTNSIS